MQQETQNFRTREVPATRVRQGRWGVQILIVLIVSLALAMAVWFGLEFYGESIDAQSVDSPGATTDAAPNP